MQFPYLFGDFLPCEPSHPGVPPLPDSTQATVVQPFPECFFVAVAQEHHVKLAGSTGRNLLRACKTDPFALGGCCSQGTFAFSDFALKADGDFPGLWKNKLVNFFFISFDFAGFRASDFPQTAAGVLKKPLI